MSAMVFLFIASAVIWLMLATRGELDVPHGHRAWPQDNGFQFLEGDHILMDRRELSAGEMAILKLIQEEYGPQNVAEEVFFTDLNEAAIFVKEADGVTSPVMANLTDIAAWRADKAISSDEEVKEWIRRHGSQTQ